MTPGEGRGRRRPSAREARARYHQLLADAQALFNLLFLGAPAPEEILLGAIEALVADGEHLHALPGDTQARNRLQRAVAVVTDQARALAPDPVERSLDKERQALREAMDEIHTLVPMVVADLPGPLIAPLGSAATSFLRRALGRNGEPIGRLPSPPRRPPPLIGPAPPPAEPSLPGPSERVWRVTCSGCGWVPRTDAVLYVEGTSFQVQTGGDGCLREVGVTVRLAHQPSRRKLRVQIVGQRADGATPKINCSVVDITPYG